MRAFERAIWTSGDPVSLSARLCSAISLPLTSFSTAKLARQYTGRRLAAEFDRPVRAGVSPRSPLPRAVDHDRVRMPELVVSRRHELNPAVGPRHPGGSWIVGLDDHRLAVGEDRLPWLGHRLGRLEALVHEVAQHL